MKISEHIRPADWHSVVYELFGALGLLGVLLLVPFFVSLVFQEYLYAEIFGALAFGSMITGFGIHKLNIIESREMKLTDALIVTALVYLLFSIMGAVPFLPIKSFLDGLFEAMSGFTTTGLTMIDESTLPASLHFFRAYSQWLGGMGIIVLTLAILLRPGKTAFKLYSSEFGEENILGSVVSTAKAVIKVYLSLTLLGFVAFYLAGMGLYDALIHILTTIPTGGFSLYTYNHTHGWFLALLGKHRVLQQRGSLPDCIVVYDPGSDIFSPLLPGDERRYKGIFPGPTSKGSFITGSRRNAGLYL